jgi:hypothetical protein
VPGPRVARLNAPSPRRVRQRVPEPRAVQEEAQVSRVVRERVSGPRVAREGALETVVHQGNLRERERETEVVEPPGQETKTLARGLEKV